MNDQPRADLVTRDQRRAEMQQLTFSPNGQLFQPSNGRELMDMANMMSTSGFMVKELYRNNPGACMALIAICSPYGLNPLQVSWKTYKASKNEDAPIAFEAQVIVAMVNASGAVRGGLRYTYEGEGDGRVCICSGIIAGETNPVEVRSPALSKITPKNSPLWKADPDQQLAYYTGRSWARRYKPEMLLGVYDVDELEPPMMRDVTPQEARPNPMAALAAKAREEAPQAADQAAEVHARDEASEGHWTDSIVTDDGAPGSAAWDQGIVAAHGGQPRTSCPYLADPALAGDWLAAYDCARKAGEE
jgi:hypothetical protein